MTSTTGVRILCFVVFLASSADAEVGSEPNRERARALLHEGNEKLDQGLYLEALNRFEQAYSIFPSPKLLFNIAQTLNELGRPLEALDHYERFVHDFPKEESPEQWRLAHERIFQLQGAIAAIEIQSNVVEAQVAVDGRSVGVTPLERPIRLLPGPHAIVIGKSGFERQVIELSLRAGETITRRVTLVTEEEGAATRRVVKLAEERRLATEERLRRSEEETRRKQLRSRSILRNTGWATIALGVAALVTGGALGIASRVESDRVEGAAPGTPWNDLSGDYDRAASDRVGSYVTAAVGGALVAAGGILVGLSRRGAAAERRATLLPAPAAGVAGSTIQWTF
jgi:tetratricopeptide (TPR) repeat protein